MKFFRLSGFLVCLAASSAAADIVDQEYVAPGGKSYILDYPGDYMAQTFKVQNSGQLTSVGLQLWFKTPYRRPEYPEVNDNLHFNLTRTNSAGEPVIDETLAMYEIAPTDLTDSWSGLPIVNLDLRSQNVQVHSGDVLALVLSSNYTYYSHSSNDNYHWQNSYYNATADGHFYLYSPMVFGNYWFYKWFLNDPTESWDAGYRVTIDAIPEPTTALLATLAAFASIACHRRVNRRRDPDAHC